MALSGEKFDGENIEITWNSLTVEPEIIKSVTIARTRKKSEKTGAGDTAERKHPHKWDYSLQIELHATDDDTDNPFSEADGTVAFVVYPNGNTTGEPTRSGNAFVDDIRETNPGGLGGMVGLSIACDVDGAVTKGTAT